LVCSGDIFPKRENFNRVIITTPCRIVQLRLGSFCIFPPMLEAKTVAIENHFI